ncbi:hypothetical protein ES703_115622 [subsurface metagenome]
MKAIVSDLTHWPRTKGGVPVLSCTEDATFFAHLIFIHANERLRLVHLRRRALFDLKVMRSKTSPNLPRMMDLAVKAQFYRECLDEVGRIEKEGA